MKKFFIKILLAFLVFVPSVAFADDKNNDEKIKIDPNTCKISTTDAERTGDDFLKVMRGCANGTSGVSIQDMENKEKTVSELAVRVKQLASGFMQYAALFAIGAIVIAGIMYTTAYGDDAKLSRAKKIALFACVGLILALASYSLVNAVIYIIYGTIR